MPSLVDTEMPASGSILRLTAFKTTFALAMNSDDDDHVMMWYGDDDDDHVITFIIENIDTGAFGREQSEDLC